MKHIIWTNDLDYNDWKEDLEENYPDEEGYNEESRTEMMYEINNDYLDDEKTNLNKELGRQLVMCGELGLWNGRFTACKVLKGTNLNDIFSGTCGDIVEWYVEDGEVKCKDCHHDGTNFYTYRLLKDGCSEYELDDLIYDNPIDDVVKEMTEPLGNYIAEVYGWEKV